MDICGDSEIAFCEIDKKDEKYRQQNVFAHVRNDD
jgi:hypothetical protein